MEKRLIAIQQRLRSNIHLSVEHDEGWSDEGPWAACIVTERNEYPYWLKFHGKTPNEALNKIVEFLNGDRLDHARPPRNPSHFEVDKSKEREAA